MLTLTHLKMNYTSLQGTISATYAELTECFGEPDTTYVDAPKTRAQWHGNTFEIYDWKRYEALDELLVWNVGGKSRQAVETVERIIERRRRAYAQENNWEA